ncbi:MAG: MFS transporter [Candidatus Hydrogenedentes bacterium]|nr:MFS transporter [Candidatus Hydrogenedentota bacterium]
MDKYKFRICLAAFLLDGALMVVLTAMPFYLYDHLDSSVAVPANIGAAQSLLYALVCLGISRWLNRIKHSLRWAASGAFYYCAGSGAAILIPNVWGFAIASTLAIMGMSIVWPSLYGWLGADPDPHRRALVLSRFNVSWSSGLAVGPLVGGFLYDWEPLAPFGAAFLIGGVCFGLLWGLPQEEEYYPARAQESEPEWDSHAQQSEHFLVAAWIANSVGWGLVGITRLVFTKRVDDLVSSNELRLFAESDPATFLTENPASIYAIIAFLLAGPSAVVFGFMGLTHRWHHRFRYIAGLQIAAAGAFWILGNTNSLVVMGAAFMIIGALSGAAFFSSSYYSVANFARRRQRASVNEFFVGVGSFVGPLAVGYLAMRYGVSTPFLYIPIAIGVGLAVQFYLIHGRKEAAPE